MRDAPRSLSRPTTAALPLSPQAATQFFGRLQRISPHFPGVFARTRSARRPPSRPSSPHPCPVVLSRRSHRSCAESPCARTQTGGARATSAIRHIRKRNVATAHRRRTVNTGDSRPPPSHPGIRASEYPGPSHGCIRPKSRRETPQSGPAARSTPRPPAWPPGVAPGRHLRRQRASTSIV